MVNVFFSLLRQGLLAFAVLFIMSLPLAASAQTDAIAHGTPEERAAQLNEMMQTELDLTDEQFQAAAKLNLHYAQLVQDSVIDAPTNRLTKYNRLMRLHREKDQKLADLFTKEQFKTYQKVKKSFVSEKRQEIGSGGE